MKNNYMPRRERIVISAVEIIDELGIRGLSTRELARRQGVTDASLYRHFKSKEEILLAVLDYYSKYDNAIFETVKINNLSPRESILFFIKCLGENLESYPALTAIMHSFEMLMHNEFTAVKTKEIFESRISMVALYLKEGQQQGFVSPDIDSEDLSMAIMGCCRIAALKWRMDNFSFPLKERMLSLATAILDKFWLLPGTEM